MEIGIWEEHLSLHGREKKNQSEMQWEKQAVILISSEKNPLAS